MAKLYEISQNISQLEELLHQMDEGDETYENVKGYLDNLIEVDFTEKVENVVKFIKNLEADTEMYKAERQRLNELEKASKRKAESLKDYLAQTLMFMGYDKDNKKVKTSVGNVGFRKLPASLKIVDLDKVPTEFHKEFKLTEDSIKKADLLKHLKDSEGYSKETAIVNFSDIGIEVHNNKKSLSIK